MQKKFEKMWTTSLITSMLFIAIGLFLFFQPKATISIIAWTIGGIIIISGGLAIARYIRNKNTTSFNFDLAFGIITIIAGIMVILNPEALASLFPLILGVWIIISSATKLQYAFTLKAINNPSWLSTLIVALIMMAWGILLILNPFKGAIAITQIIGLFIVVYAILDVIETYILKKNVHDLVQIIEKR